MGTWTERELADALLESRRAAFLRLKGGFPIPLAGALYWAVLAYLGTRLELADWAMAAFIGTGLIFPVAVLFSRMFGVPFLKDKAATTSALLPAFIGMLLFWSYIPVAAEAAPEMIVLFLAVGLSVHWPVIGWTYARTALFSAHAIIRALIAVWLWFHYPDERLVLIPVAVCAIYLLTVLAIHIDLRVSGRGETA
jgi:hypothetical protein